jgi:hypothetical protein
VPQEKIDALKQKLALAEFPDELEDSGWDLGSPLNDIKPKLGSGMTGDRRRIN